MKDLTDPDYVAKIVGHAAITGVVDAYVQELSSEQDELFSGEYWATLDIDTDSPEVAALYVIYLESFSMAAYIHRNIGGCDCPNGAKEQKPNEGFIH